MNKPTWVNAVGIVTIIMACFGLFGAWQIVNMPKILATQRQMMPQMRQQFAQQAAQNKYSADRMMQMYDKMTVVPPWFDSWCSLTASGALVLSLFFIFAGINLMRLRKSALLMFYWLIGLDIVFLISREILILATKNILVMPLLLGGIGGTILNIILLVAILNGKKEAFNTGLQPVS